MKKITLNKVLIVVAISCALLWIAAFAVCAQEVKYGSPEYYAATGTAPHRTEAPGCQYTPVDHAFENPIHFSGTSIIITNPGIKKRIISQNTDFLFVGRTLTISPYSMSDPKSRITILGKINTDQMPVDNEMYTIDIFQARDAANANVALKVLYNNSDTTDIEIQLAYANASYFYDLTQTEIPEEPYFILDNLKDISIHDKFGSDYTNEQVYEFLAQFGTPDVIINFMLRDLFYNEDFGTDAKMQPFQFQNREKFIDNVISNK